MRNPVQEVHGPPRRTPIWRPSSRPGPASPSPPRGGDPDPCPASESPSRGPRRDPRRLGRICPDPRASMAGLPSKYSSSGATPHATLSRRGRASYLVEPGRRLAPLGSTDCIVWFSGPRPQASLLYTNCGYGCHDPRRRPTLRVGARAGASGLRPTQRNEEISMIPGACRRETQAGSRLQPVQLCPDCRPDSAT